MVVELSETSSSKRLQGPTRAMIVYWWENGPNMITFSILNGWDIIINCKQTFFNRWWWRTSMETMWCRRYSRRVPLSSVQHCLAESGCTLLLWRNTHTGNILLLVSNSPLVKVLKLIAHHWHVHKRLNRLETIKYVGCSFIELWLCFCRKPRIEAMNGSLLIEAVADWDFKLMIQFAFSWKLEIHCKGWQSLWKQIGCEEM